MKKNSDWENWLVEFREIFSAGRAGSFWGWEKFFGLWEKIFFWLGKNFFLGWEKFFGLG